MKTINQKLCTVWTENPTKEYVELLLSTNELSKEEETTGEKTRENRKIKDGGWKEYADTMKNNKWKFNAASIVIDNQGILRDGRHRLKAYLESGCPKYIEFLFVKLSEFIDARQSQKTMDCGIVRSYKDQLYLDGVQNASNVGAVRSAILKMKTFNSRKNSGWKLDEVAEKFTTIDEYVKLLQYSSNTLRFNACETAVCVVFGKAYKCDEELKQMLTSVVMSSNLNVGSAPHTLNRYLSSVKGRGNHDFEIIKKTWSCLVAWKEGKSMSKVYGVDPKEIKETTEKCFL